MPTTSANRANFPDVDAYRAAKRGRSPNPSGTERGETIAADDATPAESPTDAEDASRLERAAMALRERANARQERECRPSYLKNPTPPLGAGTVEPGKRPLPMQSRPSKAARMAESIDKLLDLRPNVKSATAVVAPAPGPQEPPLPPAPKELPPLVIPVRLESVPPPGVPPPSPSPAALRSRDPEVAAIDAMAAALADLAPPARIRVLIWTWDRFVAAPEESP